MLQFFRKQSESKFVKFFLGLLMLTFVLWGFGSFLNRSGSGRNVAVVGKSKITEKEWYKALNQQVTMRERIFGRRMTNEEINDTEFRNSVIRMMINSELISQEAKQMNLLVGDETAALSITQNSFFRDDDGTIDREKLERYLQYQGLNERQFFDLVKSDLSSGFLIDAVKDSNFELDSVTDLLASAYYARHTIDIYAIDSQEIAVEQDPTDDELQLLYTLNGVAYTVPEKRKVIFISFDKRDIEVADDIGDTEIDQYYHDNIDMFLSPERRHIYHIVFDSVENAVSAAASLSGGITTFNAFKDLAKDRGVDVDTDEFEIGLKAKDELLPEIVPHVFDSPEGFITKPLKTVLGWHLFFVTEVVPETKLELADVYGDIRETIIGDLKERELASIAQRIDGDLISGLSVQDIAQNYGLKVKTRNFIYDGGTTNDTAGNVVLTAIKEKAGELGIDGISGVEYENSVDSYYLFRLQDIEPQHLQPFDEVREQLAALWKEERIDGEIRDIFGEFLTLLENSDTDEVVDFIATHNIVVTNDVMFDSFTNNDYDGLVFSALMSLMEDCVSDVLRDRKSGKYLVARCTGVESSVESVEQEELDKVLMNISQMLQNSGKQISMDAFFKHLRSKYKIEINEPVIFKEINLN